MLAGEYQKVIEESKEAAERLETDLEQSKHAEDLLRAEMERIQRSHEEVNRSQHEFLSKFGSGGDAAGVEIMFRDLKEKVEKLEQENSEATNKLEELLVETS